MYSIPSTPSLFDVLNGFIYSDLVFSLLYTRVQETGVLVPELGETRIHSTLQVYSTLYEIVKQESLVSGTYCRANQLVVFLASPVLYLFHSLFSFTFSTPLLH